MYNQKKSECRVVVTPAKRESWNSFGEEVEEMYTHDSNAFQKILRFEREIRQKGQKYKEQE